MITQEGDEVDYGTYICDMVSHHVADHPAHQTRTQAAVHSQEAICLSDVSHYNSKQVSFLSSILFGKDIFRVSPLQGDDVSDK